MEKDDSDATISEGSDLSYDVPMSIETNKRQKDYKGVLDTLKDMSLSLRRSEVKLHPRESLLNGKMLNYYRRRTTPLQLQEENFEKEDLLQKYMKIPS